MDSRRNRNWTTVQAAYQINRNYLNQYSTVRLQNAKNVRQINVKQYKEEENNQRNFNKKENAEQEGTGEKKKRNDTIFKQFCQETSFHGFNYLGEENRSNLERAFWIIVLAFFYYESVQLLIHGYQMFNTRTVIINIDGSPPLVSDIPFPAITICSSNQITKSGLERVENDERLREYKDDIISLFCPAFRSHEEPKETSRKFIESSILTSFIQKVGSMNCSKTIIEQFWLSSLQEDTCHNMQQILTFFGICHSFNMLPLDQLYTDSFYQGHFKHQLNNYTTGVPGLGIGWTPENGYTKSANFKDMEVEIPYRTTGVSVVHSLILFADIQENDFTPACNRGTKGFFVVAHNPAELPAMPHPARFIPIDRTSILKVKTTTHKLDKRLVSWKPKERKCYLEKERSLTFFRYYTELNCRQECQTNFTLLLCGCVPFYLPHLTTTPVCGPSKESCFKTLWSKVSPLQSDKICKCLPSCTELTFDVDFTNSDKNQTPSAVWNVMSKGTSKFQIFYKDKVVASYRRLLLFDWNDAVALLGGIMCLFCGGSFLSFFELINFFIFRVIKPKKPENEIVSKITAKIERY